MSRFRIERFTVADPIHGQVACVQLVPEGHPTAPLCLFLYGGGGNAELLADLLPVFEEALVQGQIPALRILTPEVGPFSFYLDDMARGMAWESFIVRRLLPQAARWEPIGVVGISMGGYGALKIAFEQPGRIRAVAAVSPMIEPACEASEVPLRNRFHYPPDVPQALLGARRDADLYRADHPANRARRHAAAIRANDLAIYVDAASDDALNAHDGAEFLHRVLWELDIAHEYRLLRDADHVGPTVLPRLMTALAWVGHALVRVPPRLSELEQSWVRWLEGGMHAAPPPPPSPASPVFARVLRARLAEARAAALETDASGARRYGVLPTTLSARG